MKPSLSKGNLWDENAFIFWIEEYQYEFEESLKSKILNIPAEITYMLTYFEVFSLLIEDENEINMGKCRNMHPYHKLL